MSRNINCECTPRFTCRFCLQNAPTYYFTPTIPAQINRGRVVTKHGRTFHTLPLHVTPSKEVIK